MYSIPAPKPNTIHAPLSYVLTFLAMFALGTMLVLGSCGCSGYPVTVVAQPDRSVVTLIRPTTIESTPALGAETAGESQGATATWRKVAYVPSCNAFAITRDSNVYLATAEHCLNGYNVGDTVRFEAPSGWGHDFAKVTMKDQAHDRALLSVGKDAKDLRPLVEAQPPGDGAHVTAVSAFYKATSSGVLLGNLSTSYYATTQTVVRGWSGSPELDAQGRVWGIVSGCHGDQIDRSEQGWECKPGYASVTALP